MAEIFKFFNSAPGDERWHYASDFADYFSNVLSSGLLHKNGSPNLQVKVNAGTMQTYIEAGEALIQGYQYQNTQPLFLTHGLPEPSLDRIDRIVLRLDKRNNARHIKLFVKEGVSASNPVPPTLQRDQYVFELSLAQIRLTKNTSTLEPLKLIDERMIENLCGIVYSLISVPTSVFQQQWDYWFNLKKQTLEDDMEAWQLQQKNDFETWQAIQKQEYLTWIESIKDILDENVAANLAARIANLEQELANHIAEVSHIKWIETVGGTANALTATVSGITSYKNGLAVSFPATSNSTAAMTLNINGLGAIPIKKANGTAFSNAKANGVYTVRYRAGAFILQGEGGTGNAQPSDVRKDKTFTNDYGEQVGTLVAYGTSEEIPIDKLSSSITPNFFGDLPLILNYGSILNNTAVSQTIIRYNYVDKVLHLAAGMAYKAYDGQSLKWSISTTNTTGYTHSLDAENRILYISVVDGKIAKRDSNNIAAQYWETTDTGMDGANRVTNIPGNQGFIGFQGGTTGLRFATNGNKLWTLTSGIIKGTILALCATQSNTIFVVAYEYTGSYVSTLYKINGATGAVTTTALSGFGSVELVRFIRIDEVNQKLVLIGEYGGMQTRSINDPSTIFNAISGTRVNEVKGMEIDNQGRIYVVHNSGTNGFGLTKFTTLLGVMWQCKLHATTSFTSFMLGLDIDRTPNTPYPELYLARVQGSGSSGEVFRSKQTYTIMT
ncbi:hypothetical protein [Lysinibacillus sp. Y5S-8]|uniref:hypothetical protein n=1 Tax=Lysinibacillus sp. Y5S-8 TaxID=3122488 RepID=UPI0030CEEE0F